MQQIGRYSVSRISTFLFCISTFLSRISTFVSRILTFLSRISNLDIKWHSNGVCINTLWAEAQDKYEVSTVVSLFIINYMKLVLPHDIIDFIKEIGFYCRILSSSLSFVIRFFVCTILFKPMFTQHSSCQFNYQLSPYILPFTVDPRNHSTFTTSCH